MDELELARSREYVRRSLRPHVRTICASVEHAWERWLAFSSDPNYIDVEFCSTTRANFVNDALRTFFKRELPTVVTVVPNHRSDIFVLGDDVALRFKKLSADGLASNVRTSAADRFNLQLDLNQIPSSAVHINVGYVLNEAQTEVVEIMAARPSGNHIAWVLDLRDIDATPMPSLFDLMSSVAEITHELTEDRQRRSRVRLVVDNTKPGAGPGGEGGR